MTLSLRHSVFSLTAALLAFGIIIAAAWAAAAQTSPFQPGWRLDPEASYIHFGSIKYVEGVEKVETHSFKEFTGEIDASGVATITVKLESVETNDDLRNVRMRFLFFEAFKYPEAVVSLRLTPEMAEGLAVGGSKRLSLPFSFSIHGATNQMTTDVEVAAEADNRIVASSTVPIIFRVEEFGLQNNLTKIAETAGGFEIVPKMTITYQFAFVRAGDGPTPPPPTPPPPPPPPPDLDLSACIGRFEILSESGNIYFASGSARLEPDSDYILTQIVDIIDRCPGLRITIAGHTDSDGSRPYNQDLSERRAGSVVRYLQNRGIDPRRLFTTGYGEDRPFRPNDSAFNKSRNRRIEFSLYQ